MKDKEKLKNDILQKLDEISKKTELMRTRVLEGDVDICSEARELDESVRELKARLGLSAFDKTAYQREYMRRKRSKDPNYRPIIKGVEDLPEWRKTPPDIE